MSVARYIRRSLIESPYISVTVALTVVGLAAPTISYFNGGKQAEAANRFDLVREIRTDPRVTVELGPQSSAADIERQRRISYKKYLADRAAARGE